MFYFCTFRTIPFHTSNIKPITNTLDTQSLLSYNHLTIFISFLSKYFQLSETNYTTTEVRNVSVNAYWWESGSSQVSTQRGMFWWWLVCLGREVAGLWTGIFKSSPDVTLTPAFRGRQLWHSSSNPNGNQREAEVKIFKPYCGRCILGMLLSHAKIQCFACRSYFNWL